MKRIFTTVIFTAGMISANADIVRDTVYMNKGRFDISNNSIPVFMFNGSPQYDTIDAVIYVKPGDDLELTVYNQLDRDVELNADFLSSPVMILESEYQTLHFTPNTEGAFTLFATGEELRYMGLSTAVIATEDRQSHHVWNMRDFEKTLNLEISKGSTPDFNHYIPDIFTLNSESFHLNLSNERAKVYAGVGDSVYIHFLNSGMTHHAPHFHGYHIEILSSNRPNKMIGWEKDSFPLLKGEIITVLLVPHQPGMYPVHDHNLKSSTTDGNYPGGMMGMLHIAP